MNDLSEFIRNNKALEKLELKSEVPLTLEQSATLSQAISSASQLVRFNTRHCHFENDGSLEQMLEGCKGVKCLWVTCNCNSQSATVAALLRDPGNVLRDLSLYFDPKNSNSIDVEQAPRDVTTSLDGNTCLNRLRMSEIDCVDSFDKLLCDISSTLLKDVCWPHCSIQECT